MRKGCGIPLILLTVVALLLILGLFGAGRIVGCHKASLGAADVQVSDPLGAVREAHRLIAEARSDPERLGRWIGPEEAPLPLRIPELMWIEVFEDHINLVMGRNPDWTLGARIWSADSTRTHADAPTRYPGIFFFDYTNDLATSPSNLR